MEAALADRLSWKDSLVADSADYDGRIVMLEVGFPEMNARILEIREALVSTVAELMYVYA